METPFTPWASLAGGMLIGLAAVLFMAVHGRIAGISGIVSRLLAPATERGGRRVGAAFVLGLLLAAPVTVWITGSAPEQHVSSHLGLLAIAGLLVGFGSVLGSGCTSGHGVCGLSRLSVRSLIATVIFMGTAFLTVALLRHGLPG